MMTVNGLLSAILDMAASYFDTLSNCTPGMGSFFVAGGWLSNYLYLSIHNFQAVLFLIYTLTVTGWINPWNKVKRIRLIIIPYLIDLACLTLGCLNLQEFKERSGDIFSKGLIRELVIIKTTGYSYFNKFSTIEEGERAKKSISTWMGKHLDTEYIYDCENGVMAAFVDMQTDGQMKEFYENAMEMYHNWAYNDVISMQLANIRIPEEADRLSSILVFLQSEFDEDKHHPHLVPKKEILAIKRSSEVERAVLRGIEGDTIKTVFHPIMDNKGRLHAAEALSRMNDPVLGNVPPFEFITAAENNGMIWKIGLKTLSNSCKLLHSMSPDIRPDYIEVNLSPVQFMHGGCLEAFMEILQQYDVNPRQINFEITESAIIKNKDTFLREKNALTEAGFSFSIDDYGSGFSNYSYVKTIKPEFVKLDRDTLLDAENDKSEALYYRDTVQTLHDLGYKIVAEGVETESHLDFVLDAGVDCIQGFYYSKPVSDKEFIEFAKKIKG